MNDIMVLAMKNKKLNTLFEEAKDTTKKEDKMTTMEIVSEILSDSGDELDTMEMYNLETAVTSFKQGELAQEDFLETLESYQNQLIDKDFLEFLHEVEELVNAPILKGNEKAERIGSFIKNYKNKIEDSE